MAVPSSSLSCLAVSGSLFIVRSLPARESTLTTPLPISLSLSLSFLALTHTPTAKGVVGIPGFLGKRERWANVHNQACDGPGTYPYALSTSTKRNPVLDATTPLWSVAARTARL